MQTETVSLFILITFYSLFIVLGNFSNVVTFAELSQTRRVALCLVIVYSSFRQWYQLKF